MISKLDSGVFGGDAKAIFCATTHNNEHLAAFTKRQHAKKKKVHTNDTPYEGLNLFQTKQKKSPN